MVDRSLGRRSAARYLVPIALAATIASTFLIVANGLHSNAAPARVASHPGRHRQPRQHLHSAPSHGVTTSYVVRSGDTLGSIATRFRVSVAQIEQLNPTLNPNALQVGQRVRVKQ